MDEEKSVAESVIVSVDFSHGRDVGVLIVGRQTKNKVDIVNALQGDEAWELWQRLIVKKEKENEH